MVPILYHERHLVIHTDFAIHVSTCSLNEVVGSSRTTSDLICSFCIFCITSTK